MWCIIKQPEAKVAALIIQGNKQRAMTEHCICFSLQYNDIWLSHYAIKKAGRFECTSHCVLESKLQYICN